MKRTIKSRTQGRGYDNGFISKVKRDPAAPLFATLICGQAAALIFVTLICGTMVGCGADDETPDRDLTGRRIAYVDANGELTSAVVAADHGNTLDMGGFELSESEIVGFGDAPGSFDSITLAKGKHLDAYGDRFADIEYLHGMVEIRYISIGDHEVTAALLGIFYGTTASGEQVWFPDEIGDNVWVLVRRSDYWYD